MCSPGMPRAPVAVAQQQDQRLSPPVGTGGQVELTNPSGLPHDVRVMPISA
jgi:hypothetical protein